MARGTKNIFVCERENFALTLCLLKSHHPKKKLGLTAIVPGPTKKRTRLPNDHFYPFLFRYKSVNDEMRTCTFPRGRHQLLLWGRVGLPSHKKWDGGWATLICKWDQQLQNGMSFLFHVPWWLMGSLPYKTIPLEEFNHAWSLGSLQGLRSHDHQRIQSLGDDHFGSCLVACYPRIWTYANHPCLSMYGIFIHVP